MWDKIKSGVSSPLGPVQGFNPGKSGDQTSNNVIINVNESTTPKETAVAVKEAFDRTIQGAYWEGQAYG
jgi:hypothetical protein